MRLQSLLTAVAASALLAGAAHAQLGASTAPDAGVTPNQPAPADPRDAQTGVPSVDSTRPTGANAGQTNLPAGEVRGGDDLAGATGTTDHQAHGATGVQGTAGVQGTTGAQATTGTATYAAVSPNVRVVTNGPVPDTPENRERFGGPNSRAGQRTAPAGN